MIRTVFWFVNFVFYQIISLTFLVKYKHYVKSGKSDKAATYLHKVSSRWARRMVTTTGSKISIRGLDNIPNNETVLFVSNHQGNFDIPLLLGYLPRSVGFVAKVELKKVPIVRTWMENLQCVFLDRKDPRQSIEAILKGIENLNNGRSMVIFPEGTRSKGMAMGEFKAGSMKMALKANVIIVPVTIKGSYKLLEEKGRITKSQVEIVILPPVDTRVLNQDEKKELHSTLKAIIEKELN